MNENEIIKKRLAELSQRAFERGYTVYSDFLNLEEISILKSLRTASEYKLYGGFDNAERCVAAFGDKELSFPIVCIKIAPLQQRFADRLTHRDFLGSLMNLGINRNTLGDIVIKENTGYLFCLESISGYILQNLNRVKHTSIRCEIIKELPEFITEKPEKEEIIVSSLRADAVIAAVYKLSRSLASGLFYQDKVYINSKLTKKESAALNEKDIVSVRGHGRFIFEEAERETKKGRIIISVRIYK